MAKTKHEPVAMTAIGDYGRVIILCSCATAIKATVDTSQERFAEHVEQAEQER